MEPRENIQEMFTRFTNITNELVSLGKVIPVDEQVRKILRSLPQDERWRAKVTAIQESKDFTKFNLEELAGSLMTHELHLGTADSSRNKGLALATNGSVMQMHQGTMAMTILIRNRTVFPMIRNRTVFPTCLLHQILMKTKDQALTLPTLQV